MNWRALFPRKPTQADKIAAASKSLDDHRARNLAKMNTPHARAARKGWETRRAVRS